MPKSMRQSKAVGVRPPSLTLHAFCLFPQLDESNFATLDDKASWRPASWFPRNVALGRAVRRPRTRWCVASSSKSANGCVHSRRLWRSRLDVVVGAQLHSTVGTVDYIAPEVFGKNGYGAVTLATNARRGVPV